MIRRDLLKSSLATMVGAPALPAVAGGFPRLGTTPIHTDAEFRKALDAYINAYRAFFSIRPNGGPEDDQSEEGQAHWKTMLTNCRAWRRSRKRLVTMVLEANGYEIDGLAPRTIAAVSVDLGDAWVVFSGSSDYEGTDGDLAMNCINFCIVPRTAAMKARLDALPLWPENEVPDDSPYSPWWYETQFRDEVPHYFANDDDDKTA
jgi:hypothetical protein